MAAPGLAPPPAGRWLLLPSLPRLAQHGVGLARRSGHELGGIAVSGLQLRVSRLVPVVRCSRVEPCARGGGDVSGHALDVGLRQFAGGTGADEPGLLARLVPELHAAAHRGGPEGGHLR